MSIRHPSNPSARAPAALDAGLPRRLRARLCAWYRRERRDLPWRRTRDPYAVWISEAMLQQTRVETVIDYWTRFLTRFPSVADLARAPEEEVLAAWSGLGYYRRARSLQAAARRMIELHGGRFPDSRAAAEDLPGVGPYTAGAVLSIAYERSEALVDGNVERVLARLFDLDLALGSGELKRSAWSLAARLVPPAPARTGASTGSGAPGGPGEWNQALMELGATVCRPRTPLCCACPLLDECRAHAAGTVLERPRAAPRAPTVEVELELALVSEGGRLLLEQRPAAGRMAGMWQLPTRERTRSGLFPAAWPAGFVPRRGAGRELALLRHAITQHRIRARLVGYAACTLARAPREPLAWISRERSDELALTGMTRKALRLVQ